MNHTQTASKAAPLGSARYGIRNVPGITYVQNPSNTMQSQLLSKRRSELLEENHKSIKLAEEKGYKNELERLAENEQLMLARGYYLAQMK